MEEIPIPVDQLQPFCTVEESGLGEWQIWRPDMVLGLGVGLIGTGGREQRNELVAAGGTGPNPGIYGVPGIGADDSGFRPGGGRPPRRGGGRGGGGGDGDGDDFSAENIDPNITLASVGGLSQHIKYLELSVMYPIRQGESLKKWGMEPPKGIMFHGPPGTGKTMLAKALCNEISGFTGKKVSFFYHKGTESMSMYFGQTEAKLRHLFATAVENKPSIIFFDEIDGLCPNREQAAESTQAYVTVVTALLGLIDSVKRGDVLIIGATNRLSAIDPAIRRPGRFDKELYFPLPDEDGRRNILRIHTSKWNTKDKPSGPFLTEVAKRTTGFTGADLHKLCVDTYQTAFNRCGSPKKVQTTEADWASAFCAMNRSSTNVFGSSLYVPEPIPATIKPLLQNETASLINKVEMILPTGDLPFHIPVKGQSTQSLLFWDQTALKDQYHSKMLMRSVLGHPTLTKYPIYILDFATIIKLRSEQPSQTYANLVDGVIGQVVNSSKPCILYIPGINIFQGSILEVTKEKSGSNIFLSQLKKVKGSQKLIIASWFGPRDTHPELEDFFSGILAIQGPIPEDLKCFFNQLLPPGGNNGLKDGFLKDIIKMTQNDPVSWAVNLFGALSVRKNESKWSKCTDLLREFQMIMDDYEQKKN